MSNAIRYDSLLVRELARELHATFAGARIDGLHLDRERLRLTLRTRPRRRGDHAPSLHWQLHAASGHLTPAPEGTDDGRVQLGPPARIVAITAPPDERIISIALDVGDSPASSPRRIIIELITNQWNAIAVTADDRITAVLRERQTKTRVLRAGATWVQPRPSGRAGVLQPLTLDAWRAALAPVPPAERLTALPRLAAWASPQNAAWILGDAAVSAAGAALEHAFERYRALADGRRLTPVLLQEDDRWQPYVVAGDSEHARPSLLAAFAEAAERAAAVPAGSGAVEHALAAAADRIDALHQRLRRLEQERAGAADEALRLRAQADVLLSRLRDVPRGAASVELPDFEGGTITVELDPALGPADNATKLYDAARKRDRAAARIPDLLRSAEAELRRVEALAARVRDGTATDEELARLQRSRPAAGRDAPAPLPYRRYRSSDGLEIRVGRGSRANDDLTFRHSSPNDIWLHARDVAGAHVILRWPSADANPPATAIAEAAVLAALGSRARTSGTVPVDWTRRKHVRKPRKAGPGLVIPERVKTVFVEPDAALEERLRADD